MDLNLIAVFDAVARSGSFSAGAKELGIPKSSASRAIARLENELKVQLLFRTTRKVSLSESGTALFDRVTPLVRSMRTALAGLPERGEMPSGTLRVTAPVDLGVFEQLPLFDRNDRVGAVVDSIRARFGFSSVSLATGRGQRDGARAPRAASTRRPRRG